jgi:hypothetical protein
MRMTLGWVVLESLGKWVALCAACLVAGCATVTHGVLLEAKGPGYANKFLDNLDPRRWFVGSGAADLVKQARRQLAAAQATGSSVRWHIAEQKTADAIQRLFERNEIVGIEVVYTAPLR